MQIDSAGGSLPRRELSTGLRDGDGCAAGESAFLAASSQQLEAKSPCTFGRPLIHPSTGPQGLFSSRLKAEGSKLRLLTRTPSHSCAAGWIPRPQSRPRSQQGGVFATKRLSVSMRKALSIPRKTCPIWTSISLVQVATGRIKRIHKLMVSSIYHMKLYFPVSIFLAVDHHIFALLKYSYIYSVLWYNAGRQ